MKKRIIGIFTGNRAEYGLQFPILKAISNHPDLEYRLVVSGAHLDSNFGSTIAEINKDGFEVFREAKIDLTEDTLFGTTQAIGSGVLSISNILKEMNPDLWLVYADRFEGFAAVIAGTQMRIPTGHIEGGDITEGGALDDSVRHAMTKLSHLHFTTNQEAADRVKAMGEESWRVFNVGFPAIDLIKEGNFASDTELADSFGIKIGKPLIVFTQHSVTTQFDQVLPQLKPSLEAIEKIAAESVQVLITYPNNDAGGVEIIKELERFRAKNLKNISVIKSAGRYRYYGLLKYCATYGGACAGNSSSGIKETPAFGCPAIDIGTRQQGRLSADNVIRARYNATEIYNAFKKAIEDKEFIKQCKRTNNPYGDGGSGKKIADILSKIELGEKLIVKKMTI